MRNPLKNLALVSLGLLLPSLALGGFQASSYKKEARKGDNYWNAGAALDANPESCWQVDPEDTNEGVWMEMDIPSSEVDKIGAIIGWDKSENAFKDYARIKTAKVQVYNMAGGERKQVVEHTLSFEDKQGWQVIDIPDGKVGGEVHGGKVRITVTEVYPGKDYPNLAVSELRVHLKEFPAETLDIATPPSSEDPQHDGGLMIDGSDRSFYASAGGSDPVTMAFRAKGYGLSSLGIQPGKKPYARPKTIEMTANDMPSTHVLEDKPEMQWLLLPAVIGYTGSGWGEVQIKIVDVYEGDPGKGVAIAEVKMMAATIEDF
jgi:hypothetical protein